MPLIALLRLECMHPATIPTCAARAASGDRTLGTLGGLRVILVRVCCGFPRFFHDISDWIFLFCHFLPAFFVLELEPASSESSAL